MQQEEAEKSLRGELKKFKADKESLEEIIVQKNASIAKLSLQIKTIGVPIDPTISRCTTDDGKLAFDVCRYSKLKILQYNVWQQPVLECVDGYERITASLGAELKKFLVDCDDDYERSSGMTCKEACDGQCCTAGSTDELDPRDDACRGFTGLVHRDGICNGERSACESATISEVKGLSCTGGDSSWYGLKSSLVTESCNRSGN